MDSVHLIPLATGADTPDAGEEALAQIDAAIALVAAHAARRVRLTAVPSIETVAGVGAARASAAGMRFRLEPAERVGVRTVTVGPLE